MRRNWRGVILGIVFSRLERTGSYLRRSQSLAAGVLWPGSGPLAPRLRGEKVRVRGEVATKGAPGGGSRRDRLA